MKVSPYSDSGSVLQSGSAGSDGVSPVGCPGRSRALGQTFPPRIRRLQVALGALRYSTEMGGYLYLDFLHSLLIPVAPWWAP